MDIKKISLFLLGYVLLVVLAVGLSVASYNFGASLVSTVDRAQIPAGLHTVVDASILILFLAALIIAFFATRGLDRVIVGILAFIPYIALYTLRSIIPTEFYRETVVSGSTTYTVVKYTYADNPLAAVYALMIFGILLLVVVGVVEYIYRSSRKAWRVIE